MTRQEFIEQSAMMNLAHCFSSNRYIVDALDLGVDYGYRAAVRLANKIYGKES